MDSCHRLFPLYPLQECIKEREKEEQMDPESHQKKIYTERYTYTREGEKGRDVWELFFLTFPRKEVS